MNLKYLKFYEDFDNPKFSMDTIKDAMDKGRGIFATVVKDLPDNDPKEKLEVVDLDYDKNEIAVNVNNNIYYVDLENVDGIENENT